MSLNTMLTTLVSLACFVASAVAAEETSAPSAERGKEAVWSVASPLSMSVNSWNTIWKQWQLADRPQDFDRRAQDRYGLHPSTRRDDRFPLGLNELKTVVGPVLSNNCLLCHAGRIAGQTVIGLGNASLDLQSLQEDLAARELLPIKLPFKIGNGRGIIEAGDLRASSPP